MIKTIIAFISLLLIAFTATAQHQIVTNNNDTIEAQILFKNDSVYQYKRLVKPRIEATIYINNVKQLIAYGEDTIYNIFSGFTPAQKIEKAKDSLLTKKFEVVENSVNVNINTAQYWLIKSGQQFNSALTLNLLGTICLTSAPYLIDYKTKENIIMIGSIAYKYETIEVNKDLAYTVAGIGLVLNLVSIITWYDFSESLKKAGQQQKYSFKASPLSASVAYRF